MDAKGLELAKIDAPTRAALWLLTDENADRWGCAGVKMLTVLGAVYMAWQMWRVV